MKTSFNNFDAFVEEPELVPCTSCGCEEYSLRGTIGPWGLRHCNRCCLLYVSPRPTEADIERIYGESYFDGTGEFGNPTGYLANEAGYIARAEVLVSWIQSQIGQASGTWLDVGCGPGYLLEVVKRSGFKPVGIDVSESAVRWAKGRALEVFAVPAERIAEVLGERKFEVVTMVDTLFHLRNPGRVMYKLTEMLAPGGWIFAGPFDLTTREEVQSRLTISRPEKLGVPSHLNFVNQPSMAYLLGMLGYERIDFRPIPKTPSEVAQQLGLGDKTIRWARRFLTVFPWLRRQVHRVAFREVNSLSGYVFARKTGNVLD